MRPRTGWPIGTCSAIPPTCRNISEPARLICGGRPSKPPRPNRPNSMGAYIARRVLLMFPTLLGILLVSFIVVQFAPGGPVERVIAQLNGADTGASRVSGSSGGDFGNRAQP